MTQRIQEIIEMYFELPRGSLLETASFRRDLGFDAIDRFEIQLAVEEEYKREIPDDVAETIDSVDQLVQWLSTT